MTLITATAPALIWGRDLVWGEDFSSKNLWGAVCPPRPAASRPRGYLRTDEAGVQ